ncbi:hypothetical protein [Frigoribacterium sp. MEB024]|uniref:ORC-CDC6 family AAA ATPase n=1 Tax=Frigoribacterium sp. MEB024 TaxID=1589899 RepID=UPI000A82DD77|nr:hypothetical protein [Frigoribacterium sp. MEB024]
MTSFPVNPFEVTKAADLSDEQIQRQYVVFTGSETPSLFDPSDSTARFLVGAKGGGRTHLMRRMTLPLQVEPAGSWLSLRDDGYVGIYLRASGLNGARFSGKSVEGFAWESLFSSYLELWLARQLITTYIDLTARMSADVPPLGSLQKSDFWHQMGFSHEGASRVTGAHGIEQDLRNELRRLDQEVNAAAFGGQVSQRAKWAPGQLLFNLARYVVDSRPELSDCSVTFFIDEFENFTEDQQRAVNTFIREREHPVTFIIGSRLSGIKTHGTFSGGEVNRVGSEIEFVTMESVYQADTVAFENFCAAMIETRLADAGSLISRGQFVRLFGEELTRSAGGREAVLRPIVEAEQRLGKKYMAHLRNQLADILLGPEEIDAVVQLLDYNDPVLSKAAILRFYQLWRAEGRPGITSARAIRDEFSGVEEGRGSAEVRRFLDHHRLDLIAQLYDTYRLNQPQQGFQHFVSMSGFIPRNLLITLKAIVKWSFFFGESAFRDTNGLISNEARNRGVSDAADWFFQDSLPMGSGSAGVETAVHRLGAMLRKLRFSDKPVEVNCSAVSFDTRLLSGLATQCVEDCVASGLVLRLPRGQAARNSGVRTTLLKIHPMISAKFDLGTARRGVAQLSRSEVEAIFGSATDEQFDQIVSERLSSMNAPFVRRSPDDVALF